MGIYILTLFLHYFLFNAEWKKLTKNQNFKKARFKTRHLLFKL